MTNTDPIEPRADMNETTDTVHIDRQDVNVTPQASDPLDRELDEIFDQIYTLQPGGREQAEASLKALIEQRELEARIDEQQMTTADSDGAIYVSTGPSIADDLDQEGRIAQLNNLIASKRTKED